MQEQVFLFFKEHLSTAIFLALSLSLSLLIVFLVFTYRRRLSKRQQTEKNSAISNKDHFNVNFSIVALFMLFELVIIFLLLWGTLLKKLGYYEFFSMLFFLVLVCFAFVYAWRKGVLE